MLWWIQAPMQSSYRCILECNSSFVLSMKNGLPYLSKELFWRVMKDIARKAKLVSRRTWGELKDMIDNRTHEPQPQIHSVKAVAVPETPKLLLSATPRTRHFIPGEVRRRIVNWFRHLHPFSLDSQSWLLLAYTAE